MFDEMFMPLLGEPMKGQQPRTQIPKPVEQTKLTNPRTVNKKLRSLWPQRCQTQEEWAPAVYWAWGLPPGLNFGKLRDLEREFRIEGSGLGISGFQDFIFGPKCPMGEYW